MQRIDLIIRNLSVEAIRETWKAEFPAGQLQVQKTRKEFEGDFTLVVFPLTRLSKTDPVTTGNALGTYLVEHSDMISEFNVIKGFLNLSVARHYWESMLKQEIIQPGYGRHSPESVREKVMIEFSSPNTNKPLHLGHVRNNLLGHSISRILEAAGREVMKVNLVNDRGIHICKSMLAWKKFGNGETPGSSGIKGDHLVGRYYVLFEKAFREEVGRMVEGGMDKKKAEAGAPLLEEAREMLRNWEAGDRETRELWEMMNGWVYDGFNSTYERLGVSFDRIYLESDTYRLGRKIVLGGLEKGILYRKEDGSVWADLTGEGLDHKLLLRSDGTSVYMTQDVGTAHQRYGEYPFDRHIYVVGNEQNYHFQVLTILLTKLGFDWAERLYHLSYGMVELPEGKMKSREGTVVDADDLMDEMEETARVMSEELGKLEEYTPLERERICRQIGMGALKYFILKVDPRKNMTFNPRESVDFNGNTGPFIQYTYARINSVLRRAADLERHPGSAEMNDKEIFMVRMMYEYPEIIGEAAQTFNPSLIANYLYDLAREFNQFYHDYSILSAETEASVDFRLVLVEAVGRIIESGMELMGIEVPERM